MVRTRAIVFNAEGKLLVQHHLKSDPDFYRVTGGGVRLREKAEDCLVREVEEETRLKVEVDRLLWVRDFIASQPYHSIELFFLASIIGGEFNPTPEDRDMEILFMSIEELEDVIFYPRAFLPKLKLLRENRKWSDSNIYVREAN